MRVESFINEGCNRERVLAMTWPVSEWQGLQAGFQNQRGQSPTQSFERLPAVWPQAVTRPRLQQPPGYQYV